MRDDPVPDPAPDARTSGEPARAVGAPSAWSPFAFVIASLLALLLVPIVVERTVDASRRQIQEVVEPARDLINELQLAVARQGDALRGYMLTGDTAFLAPFAVAASAEERSLEALEPLVARLDPAASERLADVRTLPARA